MPCLLIRRRGFQTKIDERAQCHKKAAQSPQEIIWQLNYLCRFSHRALERGDECPKRWLATGHEAKPWRYNSMVFSCSGTITSISSLASNAFQCAGISVCIGMSRQGAPLIYAAIEQAFRAASLM